MVLTKTIVPISLGLGIDTKTDSFQMEGGLLNLENAYVLKTKQLQKRPGYVELSTETLDGYNPIPDAIKISNFGDELVLLSSSAIYTWAPSSDRWVFKGTSVFTEVGTQPIVANSYQQLSPDMAATGDTAAYAWEDSRGGVYSTVRDLASGAVLISEQLLNADGVRPRCVAVGDFLFVFLYDTVAQELLAYRVSIHSASAWDAAVTVANDINTTTPIFDVTVLGSSMIVAFRNASNQLRILYYLQRNAVGGILDGFPDPTSITAEDPDVCISVYRRHQTYDLLPGFYYLSFLDSYRWCQHYCQKHYWYLL